MSTQPRSTKTVQGIGRVAKVAVAVALLAVGAWALGPAAVRMGRWTVSKVFTPTEQSQTPAPMDDPTPDEIEVEPAATWRPLDPPAYSGGDWPGWRGTDGDNCSLDARCPTVWSESQNVKWRAEVPGKGY